MVLRVETVEMIDILLMLPALRIYKTILLGKSFNKVLLEYIYLIKGRNVPRYFSFNRFPRSFV